MDNEESIEVRLARIDERSKGMSADILSIRLMLESNYVTQKEFAPIQKLVYGIVGCVLLTVLGGLLALVVIQR